MNRAYIYESPGEGYVLVRGRVAGWFRDHRIPAYRSNVNNGWWVRRERLDDVFALMETTGVRATYIQGHAPRHVPLGAVDTDDGWRAA